MCEKKSQSGLCGKFSWIKNHICKFCDTFKSPKIFAYVTFG